MLCPAVSTLGSLWKFRLNNARAAKKGTSKTCDRGQDDCSFGEKGHNEMGIASSFTVFAVLWLVLIFYEKKVLLTDWWLLAGSGLV